MIDQLSRLKSALADRHRPVAIKVLLPELAAVLGPDRFLQEIEIAAGLQHPHILPLYDSGSVEDPPGFLYYVMPYVEGESLRDRLAREKQLSVDDALQISREVADALSYAHSRGVVHRDIKPENILLQSGHAVVADFGIARAIDRAGGESLTATGLALGTPAYMSPEQAAGSKDLDGRSDLYSLACVLYEMLAGEVPFTGPTVESLVHQHLTVEPPNITALRPAVPAQVAATLQRSLAKTPADRFNPVAQFAEALGPTTSGVTTSAPTASPTSAARRWSRKRLALLALAAVIVVVAAVLIGRRTVQAPGGSELAADRVVVLPYDNRTGDPALDPVGQMAAEWITEGLMQTGAVQVVPNFMAAEAIAQARDESGAVVLGQVAERTQSGIAVMGSYYLRGEDLEFHSEVVEVASGTPFSAIDLVSGSAADPRGAIDSVRIQVMGALATRLSPLIGWELPPTVQPPTYEASQAYVRGMGEWGRADYDAAASSFEQAYALDTTYVRSLLLAAGAHGNLGRRARSDSLMGVLRARRDELSPYDRYRLDYGTAGRRGDRPAALAAARAGVELVPFGTLRWALMGALLSANRPHEALRSIEEVHSRFMAVAGEWYRTWELYTEILHVLGEHERELELAREAREIARGPLFGMLFEGIALATLGRLEELEVVVGEILLAAPQSVMNNGTALLDIAEELRAHGDRSASLEIVDRALEWYEEQTDEFKTTTSGRSLFGRLLYQRERWDEAAAVFTALGADSTDLVDALGFQGTIAARQGDVESARRFASELAALELPLRGRNTAWRAEIAALLGERDEAVGLLQRAFSEGVGYGIWIHRDMDLESLRDYAPYQEMMEPKG
jgi:tetratricopeptide (TPR) repeat protein